MSFNINSNTIIIVESETIIHSKDFLKIIHNFGNIYLAYNNHVELINHNNSKNPPIKIITYKELLLELSSFEAKSLNYFFDRGLNKNINQNSNITFILTTIRNKTKLESHDFSYKDSNRKIIYDVPYYHKGVPEGFSVFCTDEEFELVMNYIKKKENNPQKSKPKEKNKEINIVSEPEPSKKNFICQLCRSRFDNYKEHILSDTHCKNIHKHQNSFRKLSHTFKRIIKNYSYEKNNFIYSTPKKEFNSLKEKNKENSYNKSLSSLLTNESNNLIEFSPDDIKKINNKTYNLRIKKSPSFGRDSNDNFYYFMTSSRNNSFKMVKNNNDNSPMQQASSTASSTFKNVYAEDSFENSKSKIKLNSKRKRDEGKDNKNNFFEQLNSKNKKVKK